MQLKLWEACPIFEVGLKTLLRFIVILMLLSGGPIRAEGWGFTENKGQLPKEVLFEHSIDGGAVWVEQGKLVYIFYDQDAWKKMDRHPHSPKTPHNPTTLRYHRVDLEFVGAVFMEAHTGVALPGTSNYFLDQNPALWAGHVKKYTEITYKNIWNGIDLQLLSSPGGLKYNFIIHPGASAGQIQLLYKGAESVRLKKSKELLVATSVNVFKEKIPLAFVRNMDGVKPIKCRYLLHGNQVSFQMGAYPSNQTLIIDPILVFSTYSGSTVDNFGFTATYDSKGCLYAGGIASNPTRFPGGRYPATPGVFQYNFGGGDGNGWEGFPCDISISKYTPDGDSLVFATYLGGSRNEYPHSIVVDQNDQLIVFGTTTSRNFPVTPGGFDTTFNGGFDMIISRFSHDGSVMVASTFLGGSSDDGFNVDGPLKYNYADEFRGEVDIDNYGNIYIASSTRSKNFPVSANAPQKLFSDSLDAVMLKFDSTLNKMIWGSFWGQSGHDAFYSVEIQNDTLVYFGGSTTSSGLPVDSQAIDTAYIGGRADGYIACFSNNDLSFLSGTYIGTPEYNQIYFIEQDIRGRIYATGQTDGNFPVVGAVFSQAGSGQFIIKMDNNLRNVLLSTVFGTGRGTADLNPSAFMIDYCENVYFSGWGSDVANPTDHVGTTSGLFVSPNAVQKTTDGNDFYLIVFSKNLQNIAYATYFGSPGQPGEFNDHVDGGTSRFDPRGVVYQSVCSSCPAGNLSQISNFPTTANAFSKNNPSPRCSNASFKIDFQISNAVMADFSATPGIQCFPGNIIIQNKTINGKRFYWDFGDTSGIDTSRNPVHVYKRPGIYTIRLIANDSNSCNVNDTAFRKVALLQKGNAAFSLFRDSCTYRVKVKNESNYILNSIFYWGDGTSDTSLNAEHIYTTRGNYTIRLVINKGMMCADSIEKQIFIAVDSNLKAAFIHAPDSGCMPLRVNFTNQSTPGGYYLWDFGDGSKDTATNPVHIYTVAGTYKIKLLVTDLNGCGFRDSVIDSVRVLNKTTASFITEQLPCEARVQFYPGNGTTRPVFWDFGDGASDTSLKPEHMYKRSGTYAIVFVTGAGTPCSDTLRKDIQLVVDTTGELVFPNVFTPDGDMVNDTFRPGGIQQNCDIFKMYIYNNWGELLFVTDRVDSGWTGIQENGSQHPSGTYFWLMDVGKGGAKPVRYKGTVLLLRRNEN